MRSSWPRQAVAARAALVCAWGGDGTVNEVARALAGTGHGARHRAVGLRERSRPRARPPVGPGPGPGRRARPAGARDRRRGRRGPPVRQPGRDRARRPGGRALQCPAGRAAGARALRADRRARAPPLPRPGLHDPRRRRDLGEEALAVICANARQYGGGAVVAPTARPDDGQLDLVVVAARPPLEALRDSLHLFRGTLDRAPGVRTRRTPSVEIAGREPILFHVDRARRSRRCATRCISSAGHSTGRRASGRLAP